MDTLENALRIDESNEYKIRTGFNCGSNSQYNFGSKCQYNCHNKPEYKCEYILASNCKYKSDFFIIFYQLRKK